MREIKFRAKHKNGEWVYGTGIVQVEKNTYDTDEWELVQKVNYDELDYFIPSCETYKTEEIDINTLGQYTGLHDKNGKEIYEGDIVKGKYLCESNDSLDSNMKEVELIGKIIFEEGAFMVKCISGHIHDSKERAMFTLEYFHIKIEVIDNIYDNPELLKEE